MAINEIPNPARDVIIFKSSKENWGTNHYSFVHYCLGVVVIRSRESHEYHDSIWTRTPRMFFPAFHVPLVRSNCIAAGKAQWAGPVSWIPSPGGKGFRNGGREL
jgi:hypothetical protein